MKKTKNVALIADWISDWGGAEKVFAKLMEMYPEADIYTSVFWQHDNPLFQGRTIITSFIQRIPFLNKRHKMAMFLRPMAFESFDLSGYDLVISSSSAESKGVITHPGTTHVCYCHTPTRYLWSHEAQYLRYMEFGWLNPLARLAMGYVMPRMKRWDKVASVRPDYYIANSKTVAERIQEYYGREAVVVHPFFTTHKESKTLHIGSMSFNPGEYYFAIGRCIPYKKFDLLVETFNKNGKNLVIATSTNTPIYRRLKRKSRSNIYWAFQPSDSDVARLFSKAKAYIMPQDEDFGITPIEAMSHGCPVIAYRKGGAIETIVEGETGVFFDEQTSDSLGEAVQKFEAMKFAKKACTDQAKLFDEKVFEEKFRDYIESL